jgi:hypothetical protein
MAAFFSAPIRFRAAYRWISLILGSLFMVLVMSAMNRVGASFLTVLFLHPFQSLTLLYFVLYGASKASYAVILTPDGILRETQWMRKDRVLPISEIKQLTVKRFATLNLLTATGPLLVNLRYPIFPRECLDAGFVENLLNLNPALPKDPQFESARHRIGSRYEIWRALPLFLLLLPMLFTLRWLRHMSPQTISDCSGAGSEGAREMCYAAVAERQDTIAPCPMISETVSRNSCYANHAVRHHDISVCQKLGSVSDQNQCLDFAAAHSGDHYFCDQIMIPSFREGCYEELAHVTGDDAYCNETLSEVSRTTCLRNAALAPSRQRPRG